jgi:hypothetical protein
MNAVRQGYHGRSTHERDPQTGSDSNVGWYQEHITSLPEAGRKLLEEYSGIPSDEGLPHVHYIRDKAFAIFSYACIGQFRFLNYSIPKPPYYRPVLELRSGGTFVDAGCCFGQEIRFLIHEEKIPAKQLYSFDLEPAFIDLGYELFRDKEKLCATMLSGDLLADLTHPAAQELTTRV